MFALWSWRESAPGLLLGVVILVNEYIIINFAWVPRPFLHSNMIICTQLMISVPQG